MAALQPKSNGGPITKFWDAPETVTALEHVKGWLGKNCKKVRLNRRQFFVSKRWAGTILFQWILSIVCKRTEIKPRNLNLYFFRDHPRKQHVQSDPPTAKSLAQLISQLIQFQEDNLGMAAKNPPYLRMPASATKYDKVREIESY